MDLFYRMIKVSEGLEAPVHLIRENFVLECVAPLDNCCICFALATSRFKKQTGISIIICYVIWIE